MTQPRSFAEHMATRAPLAVLPLPIDIQPFRFSIGYSAALQSDPAHAWFRSVVLDVARSVLSPHTRRASRAGQV